MKIRGTALIHARTYLRTRWGSQALAMLDAKLPAAARTVFSSPELTTHGWYPVTVWNSLVEEVVRWPNRHGALRDIAAYIAEQDLNMAHKVLLKLGTPEL